MVQYCLFLIKTLCTVFFLTQLLSLLFYAVPQIELLKRSWTYFQEHSKYSQNFFRTSLQFFFKINWSFRKIFLCSKISSKTSKYINICWYFNVSPQFFQNFFTNDNNSKLTIMSVCKAPSKKLYAFPKFH